MGIGTSLGAFHEDEFAHIASPWMEKPENTPDKNTLSPNEIMPSEEAGIEPQYLEISNKGPDGNVTTLRIPANDNKNLTLGDGIDLDTMWAAAKKAFRPKPILVPK